MRTWAYIDGFNLYYAVRDSGCKWLNVKALTEAAMPNGTAVEKTKYIEDGEPPTTFPPGSYPVSPDTGMEGNQTELLPVGKYGKGNRVRQPAPDAVKALVHALEEKGSDVNLASHLVNDGWAGRFDAAIVVWNDTEPGTRITKPGQW